MGGFITERLGRVAEAGEELHYQSLLLEVETVEGGLITSVIVRTPGKPDKAGPEKPEKPEEPTG